MNIPEAVECATQAASRQIHGKFEPRRNPFGKIYDIYIFCALVFTDQFNMRCRRSGVPQQLNEGHFFFHSKFSFTFYQETMR